MFVLGTWLKRIDHKLINRGHVLYVSCNKPVRVPSPLVEGQKVDSGLIFPLFHYQMALSQDFD